MITAAVLIILGSLTAFNVKIKQIYLSGSYKSKFNGMDFMAIKGLEKLNIEDANALGIQVEQGNTEGVWIRGDQKSKFLVDFKNHTLKIGLNGEGKKEGTTYWGDIVIVTKTLSGISSSSSTKENDPRYNSGTITLIGLQLNQLDLQISDGVTASLNNMQMDVLNATVGDQNRGNASLNISSDTHIKTAQLNVPGKSNLTLADPKITKAVYNLSDSATVSVNGKMVQLIK